MYCLRSASVCARCESPFFNRELTEERYKSWHKEGSLESGEPPMTLQIGMLGLDGVILAGDTRVNVPNLSNADAPWMSYEGQKIHISKSGRIAVSCAHDLQSGRRVAEAIFAKMSRGDHPSCECEIAEVGAAAAQGRDIQCMVAFSDPLPSLYIYTHAKVGDSQLNDCQRIISCVPSEPHLALNLEGAADPLKTEDEWTTVVELSDGTLEEMYMYE
jgi:hypothetical protein